MDADGRPSVLSRIVHGGPEELPGIFAAQKRERRMARSQGDSARWAEPPAAASRGTRNLRRDAPKPEAEKSRQEPGRPDASRISPNGLPQPRRDADARPGGADAWPSIHVHPNRGVSPDKSTLDCAPSHRPLPHLPPLHDLSESAGSPFPVIGVGQLRFALSPVHRECVSITGTDPLPPPPLGRTPFCPQSAFIRVPPRFST